MSLHLRLLPLLLIASSCAHVAVTPAFKSLPADAPLTAQLEGATIVGLSIVDEDAYVLAVGPAGQPLEDATGKPAGFVHLGVLRVRDGQVAARTSLGDHLLPLQHRTAALSTFDPDGGRAVVVLVSSPESARSEKGRVTLFRLDRERLTAVETKVVYERGPVLWYPRIDYSGLHFARRLRDAPESCFTELSRLSRDLTPGFCDRASVDDIARSYDLLVGVDSRRLFPGPTPLIVQTLARSGRAHPCRKDIDAALDTGTLEDVAELATRPECAGGDEEGIERRFRKRLAAQPDPCKSSESLKILRGTLDGWRAQRHTSMAGRLVLTVEMQRQAIPAACGRDALEALRNGRVEEAGKLLAEGAVAEPLALEAAAGEGRARAPRAALLAFAKERGLTGVVAELETPPSREVAELRARARRLRPKFPYAAAFAQALAKRLGDTLPYTRANGEPDPVVTVAADPSSGPVVFATEVPANCPEEVRQHVAAHPRREGKFRGFEVVSLECGFTEGGEHVERTERQVEREVVGQMQCNQAGAATLDPLSGCQGLQKKTFTEEGVRVVKDRGYARVTGLVRFVDGSRRTRDVPFSTAPTSIASGYFTSDVTRDLQRKVDRDRKTGDALLDHDLRDARDDDAREEACAKHLVTGGLSRQARSQLVERYGQPTTWRGWPWNDVE